MLDLVHQKNMSFKRLSLHVSRLALFKSLNELSNDIANLNFVHAMRAHYWFGIHASIARFYFT